MRAFVYCRVSTKEQSTQEHYSLDNQEQRCRDYINLKKWHLHKVRKDVASGKSDAREGFQELLSAIRSQKVDVVVVYRLDRLSRNVRDIYDFLDTIKNSGVAFVSVTEGFDTTTAMGRAMLGVAAVFAQLTREMIAENVKDGLLRRAEAGLFNGNKTKLYGYTYARETGIEPLEAEAENLRQIFTWFTDHKWGIEKIARAQNLRGVPTKTGIQWSPATVAVLLRNRVYCGEVRANGGWVPGRHEPLVTREQFELAQAIIQSRSKLHPRSQDSRHLLSGIACCGMCGRRLNAHSINQGREKKRYDFYHHKADVKVGENSCRGLAKSAHLLESTVVAEIAQMSQSRTIQRVAMEDVRKRQNTQRVPMLKERDKILLEMESMGEKFTQWADRLDAGKIDEEQFERQNARLLAKKKQLQERLTLLDGELAESGHLEVTLQEVRQALQDFPAVWQELEHEERREMLRLLIEDLKVFKTHVELKLLFIEPIKIAFGNAGQQMRSPAFSERTTAKPSTKPSIQRPKNATTR